MPKPVPLLWDIFCRVIDNHGDLGVCWRLSCDLAARGQQVRLWVDDASALQWMASGALQGKVPDVRVLPWHVAPLASHMIEKIPPDLSKFLICPMPGLLVALHVGEGDKVEAGQPLATVEAMKMENILRAEKSGTVKSVNAAQGDSLAVDAVILEME